MLVRTEFLEKIKKNLSINIYEAKIWTALLSRGVANASQLADISGVPRSRCYDVLETLEKKGFIITKLGKPIKYIAVQPEEVIARVKNGVNHESQQRVKFVDAIKQTNVFSELELLHKTGVEKVGIEDISNSVVGKNEINRQIKKMLANAKKSVTVLAGEDDYKKKLKLLKGLNGVKVNFAVFGKDVASNNGIKIAKSGVDARAVIVDGKESFFMVDNKSGPDSEKGIVVKSEFFTKALEGMFKGMLG